MFKIGKINSLTILERSDYGLYLGVIDDTPADSPQVKHATEELGDASPTRVLLPNRYCTADMTIGSTLDVFVYNDSEDRLVATTEKPIAMVGEFAYLQVRDVNRIGAFLDWGSPRICLYLLPNSGRVCTLMAYTWYMYTWTMLPAV